VLLFAANLVSAGQARSMAAAIQSAAAKSPTGAPAIIATDQEGGIVARIPGPPSASAAVMGTWPVAEIRTEGKSTAANLLTWGINVDLAPVADVARSGSFEDRQHRSFSHDPQVAAADVSAFVKGLRDGGVAATLKHFPGLGSVQKTTDDAPAVVTLTAHQLASVDRKPFVAGIAAGSDLVMMSSAVYSSLDDVPALLSSKVIGDELRRRLGFDGVVVSDALDAAALDSFGTVGERAVRAASAGADLFIAEAPEVCGDMQQALAAAAQDGTLPVDETKQSIARVDALRRSLASKPPGG
jgi:beta-N-acetylhexosaminidase